MPYNVPVGRINEWSLSVEHQFATNLVASIAYVGSHGVNGFYRSVELRQRCCAIRKAAQVMREGASHAAS